MLYERLYDRAVELYETGMRKEDTLMKLSEMRQELIENERRALYEAGYQEESVGREMKAFEERLTKLSDEAVNELYR